jgi:hypothetical protein
VAAIRVLFPIKATTGNEYDVFPDGKKFLTNTITTEETPAPLRLVLNWTAELEKWLSISASGRRHPPG